MSSSFVQIMGSDEVSPQTRRVLMERSRAAEHAYSFFSRDEAEMVEMLGEAVLPQGAVGTSVPIGKLIDQRLANGEGSGWRYAELPEDGAAYRVALVILRKEIAGGDVGAVVGRVIGKELDTAEFAMSLWFEGFKWEVVKCWLASAETMELMGYTGFADERLTAADVAPLGGGA